MATDQLTVQVIYAEAGAVWSVDVMLPPGATVDQALQASHFAHVFPNYPCDHPRTGIFGKACPLDQALADGDRVEIYRPLVFDPMESRRRRAEHREAFMIKPRNRPKRRKAKLAAGLAPKDD